MYKTSPKNQVNHPKPKFFAKLSSSILVVVFFILGFFAGNIFHIERHDQEVSKYPYIDFSRNFIDQEHYLTNIQPLREKLNKMVDEFGRKNVSLYIEFLNTGANISINPDNYIWPASLSKLPFAMVAMKKVEDGKWTLDNELVLMEGDRNDESGDLENMLADNPIGTRYTIEELLLSTLKDSDNTAHRILLRNFSNDELRQIIDAIGLERLFTSDGKVSAKEYSRLFRALYTASFLNRENSQKILEWLDDSTFDLYLTASIPPEVSFPHKYGENTSFAVYADSGIVYIPNRPYLISVMVQGDPKVDYLEEQKKSADFISTVSKETYDFFSQN